MVNRLVKLNGGAAVNLLGGSITPPASSILRDGNFLSYRPGSSPYSAYTGMWGLYLPQNDQLAATSSMRVFPDTFPAGTIFNWNVVPDKDYGGINGYLAASYGNYDDSPGTITPRQVNNITTLSATIAWTYSGDPASGLLSECWLATAAAPYGSFTKTHEIAFFPKCSIGSKDFLSGLPSVGTGSFVDGAGQTWLVRNSDTFYIAYRPSFADYQGVLPYRDLLTFLKTSGKITGTEWFNGVAFGVEPYTGAGSLTIDQYTVTYS